ncbi:MAG: hypothetical protein HY587_01770 [Candidatus Omnitrophica bacterium]|nr:hypothetical protein [Candidatus Omnitrophota bacterium]
MVLSQVSEHFFLQMAAGISFSLLLIRSDELGKGFFILNTMLAVVALALALAFEFYKPTPEALTVRWSSGLGLVFLLLTAVMQVRQDRQWIWALLAGSLVCAVALCAEAGSLSPPVLANASVEDLLRTLTAVLGGLLFGSSIVNMNLGHWYLIAKGLTFDILESASRIFLIIVTMRILLLGLTLTMFSILPGTGSAALQTLWSLEGHFIFFLMRILWGLVGPLVLGALVFRCVEIRSNTSATGLMYVIVIFLLIGELLAGYVTVLTAVPV